MTVAMPDAALSLDGLMEQIHEAHDELDQARDIGTQLRRLYVLRQRARIGMRIAAARAAGPRGTQKRISERLGYSDVEVPRRFEIEFREWVDRFPADDLAGEADWNAIFRQAALFQLAS